MAKIVYGVSGEGSGHSSRSREMLTHLSDLGHDVKVVSYDRGYINLKDDFDTFFFPPILRKELLSLQPSCGGRRLKPWVIFFIGYLILPKI